MEWLTPEVIIGLLSASGLGAGVMKVYEIYAARKDGKPEKELSLLKQLREEHDECQRERMKEKDKYMEAKDKYYDERSKRRKYARMLIEHGLLDVDELD